MESTVFSILFTVSSFFTGLGDMDKKINITTVESQKEAIHVCDASWILWYRQGKNECGYDHAQAVSYANAKRLECYQNYQ